MDKFFELITLLIITSLFVATICFQNSKINELNVSINKLIMKNEKQKARLFLLKKEGCDCGHS
jgi:uncharacterized membrane protein YobD (UPF0266 family)